MLIRSALSVAAIGGVVALSACGDDEKESSEPKVSNEQAITEIAAVRIRLDKAVEEAKAGRETEADELVSEAYLEHFEKVEGPLEEADHELNEKLEDTIREELRETIKAGKADEAEDLVAEINRDLTLAEGKLARQ
jgi:hypothetical protein